MGVGQRAGDDYEVMKENVHQLVRCEQPVARGLHH